MTSKIISITILWLGITVTVYAQSSGPEETVREFYRYNNSHSSTFSRRHIEGRRQWYTPALYRAFLAQLREDQIYLKKNPSEKPLFGDGLTFRPLDEPCESNGKSYRRSQTISRRDIRKADAYIDVMFAYPKGCTLDVEPIYYRVNLSKVGGKWLISDWTYSNGETLTRTMREHKYD